MKIYIKNTDTLKPRIKNLKQAISRFDGLSPSLGFCRDLVAQSLNWEDWNALHIGHRVPGTIGDNVLLGCRWSDGELNKEKCLERLFDLITKHFGEVITSHEEKMSITMIVWPLGKTVFSDLFAKKKTPKLSAREIPGAYLRDNILVDSNTSENYLGFIKKFLLPRLSLQGGVIFCSPLEAKEAIRYFNERGERHGVIISSDYQELVKENPLGGPFTTRHKVTWQNDSDGLMLRTFGHLLHVQTGGKMPPSDRGLFLSWVSSKIKEHETLDSLKFNATHCDDIKNVSKPLVNQIVSLLSSGQLKGANMSFAELVAPPYPIIVVSCTDSFLGNVILSSFISEFELKRNKISKRESSFPSEKIPRLLVTGYNDKVGIYGFGATSLYSGCANWSVVVPLNLTANYHRLEFEMVVFKANVANVVYLTQMTIKRNILRAPIAYWFCVRNSKKSLTGALLSIPSYGEVNKDIKENIYSIPLKW